MISVQRDEKGRLPALGAETAAMGLEPVGEFGRAPRPPVGQMVYRLPDAVTADVWSIAEARRRGRELICEAHQITARAVAAGLITETLVHCGRADVDQVDWVQVAQRARSIGMPIDASGLYHAVAMTWASKRDGLCKWSEGTAGGGTVTQTLCYHGLEIVAGLADLDGTPIGLMARLLGAEHAEFIREMEAEEKARGRAHEDAKTRREGERREEGQAGRQDGGAA